jgi:uncharacterized protein (TIGR03790 family)
MMNTRWRGLASPILFCALTVRLWAGGSGLNVVVVVNQNSTNSVQLGNYYCEQRQVPPQNLLRASWAGGNIQWLLSDFQSVLLNPLLSMLSARQLTNQIDYVLLCMDFPYRITDTSGANSTTAALFYGFVPDGPPPGPGLPASCSLPSASLNPYAGSEYPFRSVAPGTSQTNFLTVMLTSSNLAQAKLVIDHGTASDGTFPTQTVYLAKSTDTGRNIRYALFDNAIFNTRLRGNYSMQRTNMYLPNDLGDPLGYQNGLQIIYPPPVIFVPGALADQLTSYSGCLYDVSDHTTALVFLNAGAIGSYGTVVEPCGYLQKFPAAQDYFYQSRGFTMAESYYQSVTNPYQGVLVGDPLAAPFALAPGGVWSNLPLNALLSGTTNLSLQAIAADANHPVQQVDLFVDGTYAQTLTNISPIQNNSLTVTIRGRPMTYRVPASPTIPSVLAGLTTVLNTSANTNVTKVRAIAHGDRIELQSFDLTQPGALIPTSAGSTAGTAPALTTFVAASRTNFLDTVAFGIRTFLVANAPSAGSYLVLTVTKTNGAVVTVGATNSAGNTSISALAQTLVDLINATPELQGSDGLTAEDLLNYDSNVPPFAQSNLRALSAGWSAAQIQANLSGSSAFIFQPAGTQQLDQNLPDLQPRNHLYLTAGVTNLPLTFAFDTTAQADGYHELAAVLYEGSHVRTQKRLARTVRIQNTALAAVFTTLLGDTNTALEATLQFAVTANTNNISRIELFSTGGSLANVVNQPNALFSVAGTDLGLGLHPFYAIVTANNGKQYRTETKWVRLVGADSPFPVFLAAPPPKLTWPAAAGRSYDILSTTNPANALQPSATVTPSNSAAQWTDTNTAAPRRIYRVRTSN